jgi:uncharacterized membrane protein (UPF0136 family)
MQNFANVVLWVYIVLLLAGGLIGFVKAKSQVSLITSVAAAAILALAAVPGILAPTFAQNLTAVVMIVLLVVFAVRLAKTNKFMPSGLMLVVTGLALALRSLRF